MDSKQVELIIDKYWAGNTSLEEEKQLQVFFKSNDVPPHMEMYKDLFVSPELAIHPKLDKQFDAELISRISEDQISSKWTMFKVAAIALILLIASISVFQIDTKPVFAEDTFESPEEALEETKKAFILIAEAMNKGEQPVNMLSKLDQTNEKIKKKN